MNLKRQVRRLLLLEGLSNFHLAGTAWVLLLTLRGFTPVQIGLAEGVFHLASLCFELPSGMLADLMGRKGTLFASRCASLLSALAMLRSSGGAGLCLAMVLNALSYNLSSGTREAMTYDSLLEAGQDVHYLRLSALQNICWRGAGAAALLCAGVTAALGWQRAYGLDMLVDGLALAVVLALAEPAAGAPEVRPRLRELPQGFVRCGRDAAEFLRAVPAAGRLMLVNALVGAAATLLGFFLQDGLVRAGAGTAALGPLLLAAALGGVAGSRLAPRLEGIPFRLAGVLCAGGIALAVGLCLTGVPPVMALGGFLAGVGDDAFQLLTDARLNGMVPSHRRATLLSVSSLLFSVVMLVLSPLAGALWGVIL